MGRTIPAPAPPALPPPRLPPPPPKRGGEAFGWGPLSHSFLPPELSRLYAGLSARLAGDVGVVGDQHDRHALLAVQAFQQVDQLLRRLGVDRAGRLVQQDQ